MKCIKVLSTVLAFGFLFCFQAQAQLYSYRAPSGRLLITDHPINKPGYKLMAHKKPVNQLPMRSSRSGSSKYQLTRGQIDTLVTPIAHSLDVDPRLVKAVIEVESSRNYRTVSHKGAQGLMQLVPDTAARFGVNNAFDPRENIKGGVKYLHFLLGYFEGNVDYVLAAYNAGEYAVDKHGGVPPYKETRNYIRKVRRLYSRKVHGFDPGVGYRSALIKNTKKPSIKPSGQFATSG